MKLRELIYFILFISIFSCKKDLKHIPTGIGEKSFIGSEMKAYGRYRVDSIKGLELITSASHTGFSFEGDSLIVYCSTNKDNHGFLQFELDGEYMTRFIVNGDELNKIVISKTGSKSHNLWIYKATEAHTGPIYIHHVEGKIIKQLSKPKSKFIEFIGNSITCGAAADTSQFKCGDGPYQNQHSAYFAYGPRVARMLNVDYVLNSISGAGIYRTWNQDGPTLPAQYDNYDLTIDDSKKFDFSNHKPDVISIALGTNDLSDGDGENPRKPFNKKIFVSEYIKFIKHLKDLNPNAKIALTDSPMVKGDKKTILNDCLKEVKKAIDIAYPKDSPVAIHTYTEIKMGGCTTHPSVEDHEKMAKDIVDFYRGLLGS